jgi:hypothetical protein
MKLYVLIPLAVAAACLLYVWLTNRRTVTHSALWPKGMRLAGPVEQPDVEFDGELLLACAGSFGAIRCRTLRIAAGADVSAKSIAASRVRVDGTLRGVASLAAESSLVVRGQLFADDVRSPRIKLTATSKATVLTIPRQCKLDRHPSAQVKGFFVSLEEAMAVDYVRRLESLDATQPSAALPS